MQKIFISQILHNCPLQYIAGAMISSSLQVPTQMTEANITTFSRPFSTINTGKSLSNVLPFMAFQLVSD